MNIRISMNMGCIGMFSLKKITAPTEKGKTMKIILDIPNGVLCAFLSGVKTGSTGLEMFSFQLDGDDLIDGKETKLPREGKDDE